MFSRSFIWGAFFSFFGFGGVFRIRGYLVMGGSGFGWFGRLILELVFGYSVYCLDVFVEVLVEMFLNYCDDFDFRKYERNICGVCFFWWTVFFCFSFLGFVYFCCGVLVVLCTYVEVFLVLRVYEFWV